MSVASDNSDYEVMLMVAKVFATAFGVFFSMAAVSYATQPNSNSTSNKDDQRAASPSKDSNIKLLNGSKSARSGSSSPSTSHDAAGVTLLYRRKKYRFVDRSSILDTGMSMILPWRQNESDKLKDSMYRGWFHLLWLLLLCFIASQFYDNYLKHGAFVTNFGFFHSLYSHIHELLLTILPIYLLSFAAFFLQKLMAYEIFGKKYTRSIIHLIQHALQTIMIFGVGGFVFFFCEHWPFSQKFALIVQTICLYMKMHSYLLSNNELYEMKQDFLHNRDNPNLSASDRKLASMEAVNSLSDAEVRQELSKRGVKEQHLDSSLGGKRGNFYCFVACMDDSDASLEKLHKLTSPDASDANDGTNDPRDARDPSERSGASLDSMCLGSHTHLSSYEYPSTSSKIARMMADKGGIDISQAISSLQKLEQKQERMQYLRMLLKDAIFCENYRTHVYPRNVTFLNWFEFTWMPTVVYEPLYPRTSGIRLFYLLEKSVCAFLIIFVMYTLFEKFMLPILTDAVMPPVEQILKLLVPMTCLVILGFFLVFDCILNFFAECTCFADRQFYQDWWNSTTYEEFSRKWNVPVHSFLLRHIYFESMNLYKFDRRWATAGTFTFSIVFHEIILSACMHRVRPWLAIMSLLQLPLMPIMRAPVFKGKPLGNIVFWFGLILGIPMLSALYAREYCADPRFCS